MCEILIEPKKNINIRHQLSRQDDRNWTREKDSFFHYKCRTLSKRQVFYILVPPVCGICAGTLTIANIIIEYHRGFMPNTTYFSLIVVGVALIMLGTLLGITAMLCKRNKTLKRSLEIEKFRFCVTINELDRQIKLNKIKNVERDPDATISSNYKLDSRCGLLVDKPTSSLRENDIIQEHKTFATIESKI